MRMNMGDNTEAELLYRRALKAVKEESFSSHLRHVLCNLRGISIRQFVLAACLFALTGCVSVTVPLTATVTGQKIKPADLHWVRLHQTTRQEVMANWGGPTIMLYDERVFGYAWTLDRTTEWQRGGEAGIWEHLARWSLFFAYDAQDRITRFEIVQLEKEAPLEQAAKDWLQGKRRPEN